MKNKIKLLIVGTFCSSVAWAQVSDSISISHAMKESAGAIATATAEDLSHKTSINASNLLYGLLPGVQVLQNANNAWGDGASLLIRGMGTMSSRSPLILVDGFERSLNYLSGTEIASVTVLKDAASTALYGVKGANGVILVTTKRGEKAAPEINFSYQFNMGTPRKLPKFVDGYTYAQALNEG